MESLKTQISDDISILNDKINQVQSRLDSEQYLMTGLEQNNQFFLEQIKKVDLMEQNMK